MSESTIACLLVTHLPVKAERQRYPALRGKPLVIVESWGSGETALDSSAEAQGVTAGMTLPEALSRCPEAILLPADRPYYDEVFGRLADALAMRCPVVERGTLGCLYARLEGMAPVYGGEERLIASLLQTAPPIFELRVGVASGKFPAYVSAAASRPGRAVKAPPGTAALLGWHGYMDYGICGNDGRVPEFSCQFTHEQKSAKAAHPSTDSGRTAFTSGYANSP